MPAKKKGESKDDWMKRCIPYLINNEGYDEAQATAICDATFSKETFKKAIINLKIELLEFKKKYKL